MQLPIASPPGGFRLNPRHARAKIWASAFLIVLFVGPAVGLFTWLATARLEEAALSESWAVAQPVEAEVQDVVEWERERRTWLQVYLRYRTLDGQWRQHKVTVKNMDDPLDVRIDPKNPEHAMTAWEVREAVWPTSRSVAVMGFATAFLIAGIALAIYQWRSQRRVQRLARDGRLDALSVTAQTDASRQGIAIRVVKARRPDGKIHTQQFNLQSGGPYYLDGDPLRVLALVGADSACHILGWNGDPLNERPGGSGGGVDHAQRGALRKLHWMALLVGAGATVVFVGLPIILSVTQPAPPPKDTLQIASGAVQDVEQTESAVEFWVDDTLYVYRGGGESSRVFDALIRGGKASVAHVGAPDRRGDEIAYRVYALAVDDQPVRTYEQFVNHWNDDRLTGFGVMGAFALLGVSMAAWGGISLRRERRRA